MRPKLTIAIPTYNRAKRLEECVNRVIKYSKGKSVEILISDNASSDKTKEIIDVIKEKYPQILYFRNDKNLGFDGNFFNCFEKASGEYIWLLSDDDILLPNAIESVLEACDLEPICLHLNSSGIKSENPFMLGKPRFIDNGLQQYTDKNKFIENMGIYCTFISSLVFKLDLVREIQNKEQYFKTNILQSHIFFEIMRNRGLYLINTFNCIASRRNTKVKYDILETWIKNYSQLLLITAVKCGFDKERMKELLREGLTTHVYEIVLFFRQTCENEKDWNRSCIWPYINYFPELVQRYKRMVYCSKYVLKWISFKYKINKKVKQIWEKI